MSTMSIHSRRRGFVLLEAMIAVLILAVGLLALGQFQGRLMQAGAESKMVSEAIHYAQSTIDRLRSLAWDHADLAIGVTGEELVDGTNAAFRVVWEVHEQADGVKRVTVSVQLPNDGNRVVTALQTWIAEGSDVILAFEQSGGDLVNLDDELLEDYPPPAPKGVDDISIGDFQTPDGTDYIVIADESTGRALLVEGSTEGSTGGGGSGNGFARISGNIIIDNPTDFDSVDYRVSITGAALCRVFPPANDFVSPSMLFDNQTTIVGSNYRVMGYSCFVPANWQGFIRLQAHDSICVGSFGEVDADSRLIDGPLPEGVLSGASGAQYDRAYLGADETGLIGGAGIPGSPISGKAEIGSVCLVDSDCEADVTRNLVPGGHHFLVTSLNGSGPLADQCRTKMKALDGTAYVHPTNDRSNPFWDNPSNLVCVDGPCKGATGTATRFRTRFGGFFTNPPVPVNMDHGTLSVTGGFSCQSFGPFGTSGGGTYWCAVNEGVAIGQIVPASAKASFDADPSNNSTLSSDKDANKGLYYYSTQSHTNTDGVVENTLNAGVVENTLNIEKILHFTNMNFRIISGSSSTPGNGTSPTICSGLVYGKRVANSSNVSYSIDDFSTSNPCDKTGSGQSPTYECSFEVDLNTQFKVRDSAEGAKDFLGDCNAADSTFPHDF